jgi:hypothetical protein
MIWQTPAWVPLALGQGCEMLLAAAVLARMSNCRTRIPGMRIRNAIGGQLSRLRAHPTGTTEAEIEAAGRRIEILEME